MASAVVLEQHMAGMAPACDDLCRATSEDLVRQPISSDDLETATPERVSPRARVLLRQQPAGRGH